jgi:hypothetical protein
VTELEQLTVLCTRLGATPEQAPVMATQLLKRAEQLAKERGITATQALAHLIEVVVKGRAGETPSNIPRTGSVE